MRPVVVSVTGVGNSAAIPLDTNGEPQVALQGVVTAGSATWKVQQTLDDVYTVAVPTWFDHPDSSLVGATGNVQGNYAYVPRACRLAITNGTGTVQLTVIQAGAGQV